MDTGDLDSGTSYDDDQGVGFDTGLLFRRLRCWIFRHQYIPYQPDREWPDELTLLKCRRCGRILGL